MASEDDSSFEKLDESEIDGRIALKNSPDDLEIQWGEIESVSTARTGSKALLSFLMTDGTRVVLHINDDDIDL